MVHEQKLRLLSLLKWVSLNFPQNRLMPSNLLFLGSFLHIVENSRFYSKRSFGQSETRHKSSGTARVDTATVGRVSPTVRSEAQEALLEYLHCTRCLPFLHAEHMSKNSPHFLKKLLGKVKIGPGKTDIGHSISRFLRYHPINEFEPFFESMGLNPSEFVPILPRNLSFLSDDNMLLENYNVLCEYGIARDKIGRIYLEASEIFGYECGILQSELQAFEDVGLHSSFVIKAVPTSPSILTADVHSVFVKVLEELKILGIEHSWVEGHLLDGNTYNWTQMLGLLCLFSKTSCNKKRLGSSICQHPDLVLEESGNRTSSLIAFLLKFGSSMNEILLMFVQFPDIKVGKFLQNMRQCYIFLINIKMETKEIGKFVRSHPVLLGSCSLKKTNSLLSYLNAGKKRIRAIVKEDPEVLKKWVLRYRVERLPTSGGCLRSQKQRAKFVLRLGFIKNSNEMKSALNLCRGKGEELQERLDCFVKAGLDRRDVLQMIKRAPQVLNQSKGVIESKIDFYVNGLGYPVASLVAFPSYLCLTIQRVKLRLTMYDWLVNHGAAGPNLALTTILKSSNKYFISHYVYRHPRGPEVWEELKKRGYPDSISF